MPRCAGYLITFSECLRWVQTHQPERLQNVAPYDQIIAAQACFRRFLWVNYHCHPALVPPVLYPEIPEYPKSRGDPNEYLFLITQACEPELSVEEFVRTVGRDQRRLEPLVKGEKEERLEKLFEKWDIHHEGFVTLCCDILEYGLTD
ncbi:hypothetical protein VNI00_010550 [Paramarasmius palmivorus]|uniref:EF-hand domain-containing protein n=1 Tax=Paramarasmius palmivorus TaxID=297713 RepID=A0AAW0CKK1_9AGAR